MDPFQYYCFHTIQWFPPSMKALDNTNIYHFLLQLIIGSITNDENHETLVFLLREVNRGIGSIDTPKSIICHTKPKLYIGRLARQHTCKLPVKLFLKYKNFNLKIKWNKLKFRKNKIKFILKMKLRRNNRWCDTR